MEGAQSKEDTGYQMSQSEPDDATVLKTCTGVIHWESEKTVLIVGTVVILGSRKGHGV